MSMAVQFLILVALSVTLVQAGLKADERRQLVEKSLVPFEHYLGTSRENETADIWTRMNHWRISGVSIAVMSNFHLDWAKGYGKERPGGPPVSVETKFQMASTSKFVTAIPVMSRVDRGELNLDQDVNEILKTWKVKENKFTSDKKVTLRGLMSHTSGLSIPSFPGYSGGDEIPSIYQILDGLPPANTGPVVPIYIPGTRDRYSGGGITVEQLILTEMTNMSHPQLMDQEVLQPLEMNNSEFVLRDRNDLQDVASACTCLDDKPEVRQDNWNDYPEMAAAGLWSTPTDILKFASEIGKAYNGEPGTLLSQEAVKDMLTIQLDKPILAPMMFGLGPNVIPIGDTRWFHHRGWNLGYCSFFLANTKGDGAYVVANGDCGEMNSFLGEVFRSIVDVYGWQELYDVHNFPSTMPYRRRVEVGLPLTDKQDFEGIYSIPEEAGSQHAAVEITSNAIRIDDPEACYWRLWPSTDDKDKYYADVLQLFTNEVHPVPLTFIRDNGYVVAVEAHYRRFKNH